MFGRTVLAIMSCLLYGLGVALAALPVSFVGNLLIGVTAVVTFIIPFLTLFLAFLITTVIYVQTARYAASMTGLKPLHEQPDFLRSVGQGVLLTSLGILIFGLLAAAGIVLYVHIVGTETFWWLDSEKLSDAVQQAMASTAAAEEIFSVESMNLGGPVIVLKAATMIFLTCIAIFLVPRAADLDWSYDRTYTLSLVLARFLVALPFCVAMTSVMAFFIVNGLQWFLGLIAAEVEVITFVQYAIETSLFAGVIFSFEALMLRTGREESAEEAEYIAAVQQLDSADYRALSNAWLARQ